MISLDSSAYSIVISCFCPISMSYSIPLKMVELCQFVAAADQLRRLRIEHSGPSLGIERSGSSLRQEIVEYLRRNADIPELWNYIEAMCYHSARVCRSGLGKETICTHTMLNDILQLFCS